MSIEAPDCIRALLLGLLHVDLALAASGLPGWRLVSAETVDEELVAESMNDQALPTV